MIASNKGGKPDDNSGHRFRHSVAKKFIDRLDLYGGALGSKPIGKSPNLTAERREQKRLDALYKAQERTKARIERSQKKNRSLK